MRQNASAGMWMVPDVNWIDETQAGDDTDDTDDDGEISEAALAKQDTTTTAEAILARATWPPPGLFRTSGNASAAEALDALAAEQSKPCPPDNHRLMHAASKDRLVCHGCPLAIELRDLRAAGFVYDTFPSRQHIADDAGLLRTERDELLRENATLRRKVEKLERKR